MISVKEIVGNVHQDEFLSEQRDSHEKKGTLETVCISSEESNRSRLRKKTNKDTDLGIIIDRPSGLHDGDVLVYNKNQMIIIEFEQQRTLVLDFSTVESNYDQMLAAVEFGHYIGNKHWDLQRNEEKIYIPAVEKEQRQIEQVVEESPDGVSITTKTIDSEMFNTNKKHSHKDTNHQK